MEQLQLLIVLFAGLFACTQAATGDCKTKNQILNTTADYSKPSYSDQLKLKCSIWTNPPENVACKLLANNVAGANGSHSMFVTKVDAYLRENKDARTKFLQSVMFKLPDKTEWGTAYDFYVCINNEMCENLGDMVKPPADNTEALKFVEDFQAACESTFADIKKVIECSKCAVGVQAACGGMQDAKEIIATITKTMASCTDEKGWKDEFADVPIGDFGSLNKTEECDVKGKCDTLPEKVFKNGDSGVPILADLLYDGCAFFAEDSTESLRCLFELSDKVTDVITNNGANATATLKLSELLMSYEKEGSAWVDYLKSVKIDGFGTAYEIIGCAALTPTEPPKCTADVLDKIFRITDGESNLLKDLVTGCDANSTYKTKCSKCAYKVEEKLVETLGDWNAKAIAVAEALKICGGDTKPLKLYIDAINITDFGTVADLLTCAAQTTPAPITTTTKGKPDCSVLIPMLAVNSTTGESQASLFIASECKRLNQPAADCEKAVASFKECVHKASNFIPFDDNGRLMRAIDLIAGLDLPADIEFGSWGTLEDLKACHPVTGDSGGSGGTGGTASTEKPGGTTSCDKLKDTFEKNTDSEPIFSAAMAAECRKSLTGTHATACRDAATQAETILSTSSTSDVQKTKQLAEVLTRYSATSAAAATFLKEKQIPGFGPIGDAIACASIAICSTLPEIIKKDSSGQSDASKLFAQECKKQLIDNCDDLLKQFNHCVYDAKNFIPFDPHGQVMRAIDILTDETYNKFPPNATFGDLGSLNDLKQCKSCIIDETCKK